MKTNRSSFQFMLVAGACAAAMSLAAMRAGASTVTLYTFNSGQPNAIYDGLTYNIGDEITIGANPLSVTAIGAFVDTLTSGSEAYITNGATNVAFTAYIYSTTANSTPLDTVAIPIGTTVGSQGFAYAALTTTLSANTSYIISEAMTGTGSDGTPFGYNSTDSSAGVFTGATFVKNMFATTTSGYPGINNSGFKEFLGANLQYSAVPEPASFGLCAVGAMGLPLLRKRNRRAV